MPRWVENDLNENNGIRPIINAPPRYLKSHLASVCRRPIKMSPVCQLEMTLRGNSGGCQGVTVRLMSDGELTGWKCCGIWIRKDQDPGLLAEGGLRRLVQRAAAVGAMKPYTGPPATLGSSAAAQVRLIVLCQTFHGQCRRSRATSRINAGLSFYLANPSPRLIIDN
jgi:hypothetical protein